MNEESREFYPSSSGLGSDVAGSSFVGAYESKSRGGVRMDVLLTTIGKQCLRPSPGCETAIQS